MRRQTSRVGSRVVWFAVTFGALTSCAVPQEDAAPASSDIIPLPEALTGVQSYEIDTPDGKVKYGFAPDGVSPESASGCSQNVCISITGHSNIVNSWYTQALNSRPMCTYARWLLNDGVVKSTPWICANGAGVFYANWAANRGFPYPSLACNTWVDIPGRPCETIKK